MVEFAVLSRFGKRLPLDQLVGDPNSKALSLAPQNLMPCFFWLHHYLLLDKTGAIIFASLGLLWLLTLLVCVALAWSPHGNGWQQAFGLGASHYVASDAGRRITRDDKHGLYQIRLPKPNDLRDSGSVRVFFDTCDGNVLHALDSLKGSAGDAFIGIQFGLHSCQLLVMSSKILVALLGLLSLLFTTTGIVIWLQKCKSEKVVRNRRLHQA